ncbi:uncharacterized protein LOC118757014, partial [Rhagoletis pomonella]|uniref:uncharacterized protein LOC118757014 n=1 Tax=Rhagoletis pomonella TaxID=28610 RepID=UPI00177DA21D
IAQHLRLPRKKRSKEVTGIGSTTTKTQQVCCVVLKSRHTAFSSTLEAVIIPTITSCQPSNRVSIEKWNLPNNINLADEQFYEPATIDCLIGAALFYDLLLVGQIKLRNNSPVLQKTKLGWIVSGIANTSAPIASSPKTSSLNKSSAYKAFLTMSEERVLDQLLQTFWALEEHHTNSLTSVSPEEQACEDFFETTTTRCPKTNQFIVRLPFKEDPSNLGQSYDAAFKRLVSLEYKFSRNPALANTYREFINEYINKGHMTLLNNPEEARNLIPHHCVTKADSSTTKLRVVFDASCRTSNGKSLNDILLVGPTLQDDIFAILLRFRAYKYVLMADIAKMYRQVQMNSADFSWQCILWRESPNASVQVYKLQTKSLQQLAKDEAESLPIGSVVTLRDFYVDNLMTGGATTDEVVQIRPQVVELLKHGGFPLRKFATNDNSIISDIPQVDREEIVQLGDVDYIKTLGLKWSPSSDNFVFSYTESSSSSKTTKRAILSQIASFFDPLGLLNPIIVSCKILMQHLWALKLDWDESVPQDVYTQWQDLRRQLSLICQHEGFGACIYMVTRDSNGTTSSLLSAKSRVAPKKEVSLPRLELCVTLLLAELLKSIIDIFSPNPGSRESRRVGQYSLRTE